MKIFFKDGYILAEIKTARGIKRVVGETQLEVMEKAAQILRGE